MFTIIIIEQESHGEANPIRVIKNILSPGTNIDFNNDRLSNYLCCLNFEHYKIIKQNTIGLSIGIAFFLVYS